MYGTEKVKRVEKRVGFFSKLAQPVRWLMFARAASQIGTSASNQALIMRAMYSRLHSAPARDSFASAQLS